MPKQIYLNLPIKDLDKTTEFFTKLGYTFDPNFTDEKATAMIISPDITIMLLKEEFFKTFTNKEVINTTSTIGCIVAVNAESKEALSKMVKTAIESGGQVANEPYDYGWMYGESFYDINGHMWEVIYFSGEKPVNN